MKKYCLIYIPALCCFQVLVAKLTQIKSGKDGYYERRKGFKIESKGPRYELSDFVVKIGSVSMSSNFKGILVEVRLRIYTKLITLIHYHINFYYTPTTKCGGAILDSLCRVGWSVRPSVSNSCPLYNSFTNGRISFKLE